jgi:hypothetical protein
MSTFSSNFCTLTAWLVIWSLKVERTSIYNADIPHRTINKVATTGFFANVLKSTGNAILE